MDNTSKKTASQKNKEFFYKETEGKVNFFHINVTIFRDLFPIDVGYEKHFAGAPSYGNKYPYYLLHFVKSGKGYIEFDGTKTAMTKNMIFLLPPDKDIIYEMDKAREWEYYWINFNGIAVKKVLDNLGLNEKEYFIRCKSNRAASSFQEALDAKYDKTSQFFTVTHCLLKIFALIAEENSHNILQKNDNRTLFEQIFDYVYEHIYEPTLSAKSIAEKFFISPCYFSTLFEKNVNTSFKEYVNYERIKKATELIDTTNLLIKEIAESVGFSDPLYFGKVFKHYRLVSPHEYRKTRKKD